MKTKRQGIPAASLFPASGSLDRWTYTAEQARLETERRRKEFDAGYEAAREALSGPTAAELNAWCDEAARFRAKAEAVLSRIEAEVTSEQVRMLVMLGVES